MSEDERTQLPADVRRLAHAAEKNQDPVTGGIAGARALQLVVDGKAPLDPAFTKVMGMDKITDVTKAGPKPQPAEASEKPQK